MLKKDRRIDITEIINPSEQQKRTYWLSAISATISVLSVVSLVPEAIAMPQSQSSQVTKSSSQFIDNKTSTTEVTATSAETMAGMSQPETAIVSQQQIIVEVQSGIPEPPTVQSQAETLIDPQPHIIAEVQPANQTIKSNPEAKDGINHPQSTNEALSTTPDSRLLPLPAELITNPLPNILEDEPGFAQSNSNDQAKDALSQVTSVTQLSDVRPTDWAYQALRELVERYGCLAGYPDSTYRGNRAMTRYEFAAGLNSCLDSLYRLIREGGNNVVGSEDIADLKRLQQEFASEIAQLTGRADKLESRTSYLEERQFSTTVKMNGVIDAALVDAFSGEGDSETVFHYSILLPFVVSFTGKDRLDFALLANNTSSFNFNTTNNGQDIGRSGEGTVAWAFGGSTNNEVVIGNLDYTFPLLNNKMIVTVFTDRGFGAGGASVESDRRSLAIGPARPISVFAARAPLSRITGRSGVLVRYQMNELLRVGVAYEANPGSDPDRGFFNGNYYAVGQMVITPSDKLGLALTYGNTYSLPGQFKFSRGRGNANSRPFLGSALASTFDNATGPFLDQNVATVTNFYGVQGYYQLTPQINIGGFVNKFSSRLIGKGDADIWTYAGILTVKDLFKPGNLAGLIVGMEPTLTGIRIGDNFVGGFERDTSWHIEAYYRHRINNNISITPGLIWITAPNQDEENEDIVIGAVRMQFAF